MINEYILKLLSSCLYKKNCDWGKNNSTVGRVLVYMWPTQVWSSAFHVIPLVLSVMTLSTESGLTPEHHQVCSPPHPLKKKKNKKGKKWHLSEALIDYRMFQYYIWGNAIQIKLYVFAYSVLQNKSERKLWRRLIFYMCP